MPLNVQDKKAIVADVGAQLAGAQTVVLAEYRGIPVEQLTKLRASARDQGVYLRVLKNTLARRATQGTQFEPLADSMVGPLIYGISARLPFTVTWPWFTNWRAAKMVGTNLAR